MHSHLTITEYGQFIGVRNGCLTVKEQGHIKEYPLNRLKSIQILKRGISFSSDVIIECTNRGIKFFLCDFKNEIVACLSGVRQHAVVNVRQKQFTYIGSNQARNLAATIIYGKIRNQRATLLYFRKYHQQQAQYIDPVAENLKQLAQALKTKPWARLESWRDILLGMEGQAANQYWQCLIHSQLMPDNFNGRIGRQAEDIGNKALNYGYAILSSYVWNALLNAGLEPYAGLLHTQRPGKPSLVLDIMEEYRAWVVDRNIIKHRATLQNHPALTPQTKKQIIADIHKTFGTAYNYRKRKMRLESILQRQVYHLAGTFAGNKRYRSYRFRW